MNLTLDGIIAVVTLLSSGIALFFSIRKQDREGKNIDADTIKKLYDTISDQEERYNKLKRETLVEQEENYRKLKIEEEKRYKDLKKEFEDYKRAMNTQFALLVDENAHLRAWAHKLCNQLEESNIVPHRYE